MTPVKTPYRCRSGGPGCGRDALCRRIASARKAAGPLLWSPETFGGQGLDLGGQTAPGAWARAIPRGVQRVQSGLRFSMKAWIPSAVSASIMFSTITGPAMA